MDKFNLINLNQFTWYLNIALFGAIFAVFSLINNDYYIYYGLITFVFGVVGHIIYKFFAWILKEGTDHEKQSSYWTLHLAHLVLAIVWIMSMVYFYKVDN